MEEKFLPLISVEFCITSDSVDLQKINDVLNLTPSKSRKKHEWPQASIKAGIACDSWGINTKKTTSMSVDAECKKMMDILKGKEAIIQTLGKEDNIKTHFEVVIHMTSSQTPAIYLGKETVAFLATINADIGFDIYSYDEESDYL